MWDDKINRFVEKEVEVSDGSKMYRDLSDQEKAFNYKLWLLEAILELLKKEEVK